MSDAEDPSGLCDGGEVDGNLLTETLCHPAEYVEDVQGLGSDLGDDPLPSSLHASNSTSEKSTPSIPLTLPVPAKIRTPQVRPTPAKKTRTRKKAKKRGPRGSSSLTWTQVKEIDDLAHRARRQGTPLNTFVTIRGPKGCTDTAGKRLIRNTVASINQTIARGGSDPIGVTVYERCEHGHLHAHYLVHVPDHRRDLIDSRGRGGGRIHVRNADRRAAAYVTKQRRRLHPEFEAMLRRMWKPGAWIDGPRVAMTNGAKALLGKPPRRQPRRPK
jgi:hypothetical protein